MVYDPFAGIHAAHVDLRSRTKGPWDDACAHIPDNHPVDHWRGGQRSKTSESAGKQENRQLCTANATTYRQGCSKLSMQGIRTVKSHFFWDVYPQDCHAWTFTFWLYPFCWIIYELIEDLKSSRPIYHNEKHQNVFTIYLFHNTYTSEPLAYLLTYHLRLTDKYYTNIIV